MVLTLYEIGSSPLPKICHIYPTMMKLGTLAPCLQKIWKIYKSCNAVLWFCWDQFFWAKTFVTSITTEIDLILMHNLWSFYLYRFFQWTWLRVSWYPQNWLLLSFFWSKGYDIIISVHDVTSEILWCDSHYIVQ